MFRNREIRVFFVCYLFLTGVMAVSGFHYDQRAGTLVLCCAACLGAAFYVFAWTRYQDIARLSQQIDLMLHNEEYLYISRAREGELSILEDEMMKLMMRIREQNRALLWEKEHLAESLADVAHQLRTPLTSMNLILSLLENHPDETERRELLQETEELLVRMDWLLTALLKLSRLDAGIVAFQNSRISLDDLVEAALQPFLISMELHNITVAADVSKDAAVFGDRDWLLEAVQNILKNCMESVGDNGRIEIAGMENPLYTELTIHDNGRGFAKEDLYHLFERFYRGKDTGTAGYGIGLALCRTIIMRHGGTVTAKNHRQGGAVFIIRFPKKLS